jgi:hypothetical protein
MAEVQGIDKLFSTSPRGRFDKFRLLGTSQFGYTNYGLEDLYFTRTCFGVISFGVHHFADIIMLSGIYQIKNQNGVRKCSREIFYITKNPRTIPQQTNRAKMADAVLAYQGLTSSEKEVYHKRAIGKRMSGYNLFLKGYLLSH